LIKKELGLTEFSLIEKESGVDLTYSHPDEVISEERRKNMVSS